MKNFIYSLIEKKDDYRLGWKMYRTLKEFLNAEHPEVAKIYKNKLGNLIDDSFYGRKIKKIVRAINDTKQN